MLCMCDVRLLELEAREGKPMSLVSNRVMDMEAGDAVIYVGRSRQNGKGSNCMDAVWTLLRGGAAWRPA